VKYPRDKVDAPEQSLLKSNLDAELDYSFNKKNRSSIKINGLSFFQ
jgi:hypothetical protein